MADLTVTNSQPLPKGGGLTVVSSQPLPQERSFLDSVANAGEKFWEWTGKPVALALGMGSGNPSEQAAKARDAQKQIVQGIMNEPARVRQELTNALDAFVAGNPRATLHHVLTAAPLVGEGINQAAQEFSRGDYSSAIGHTGALLAPAAARELPAAAAAVSGGRVGPLFKNQLNPVEQSAVGFLDSRDVPMTAGTQTGNRFLRANEAVVKNSPLGAQAAADFDQATITGLRRVGGELSDEVHPTPQTPETAGRGVGERLGKNIEALGLDEDTAYQDAWLGRGEPAHTHRVAVRTRQVPELDGAGKPTGRMKQEPVHADVNMPVDVRLLKMQAAPILDELDWMPAADKASSAGYRALQKIVEGDDYIPAWQAEKGLSGLKDMARVTRKSGVRDAGQGIAASLIGDLQDAIDGAVARTGQNSIDGLRRGRAVHAQLMEVADLADQLRTEPVQTFRQMTWQNDSGIDFLRQIATQAPEKMPEIGRAWFQQLVEKGGEEGSFGKTQGLLNAWRKLGPETQKILFPDPQLRAKLGDFLKGADMVKFNPNTSGTELTRQATSTNPLRWAAGYLGAKVLYTPQGIELLTQGLSAPSPAAAAFVARRLKSLGAVAAASTMGAAGEQKKKSLEEIFR